MNIGEILERIENATKFPFFVFISGGTCSGKTLLAKKLLKIFESESTLLEMDNYFKNIDDESLPIFNGQISFDIPNSYHLDQIRNDISKLATHKSIETPVYDVTKNRRVGTKQLDSKMIIIVDGLYASMVSDQIERGEQKVNIFMNCNSATRLKRRIVRDNYKYGWSEKEITRHFIENIEPIYRMYVARQKSDLQIENSEGGIESGQKIKGMAGQTGIGIFESRNKKETILVGEDWQE